MSDVTVKSDAGVPASKWEQLRAPFPSEEVSKLPKPTRSQTEEVKRNVGAGIRCNICGGWHHPKVVHLDYVGHAAVTKRLLVVDPVWNWEFLHVDQSGMPVVDANGGMWITLTVLGVTRKGYGDAEGKRGPSATKELIGDAIRNAAMRFGVALELWHKGAFAKDDEGGSVGEAGPNLYPAEDFNRAIKMWRPMIESGKKTADSIIEFINGKGFLLTEEQLNTLRQIEVKP